MVLMINDPVKRFPDKILVFFATAIGSFKDPLV